MKKKRYIYKKEKMKKRNARETGDIFGHKENDKDAIRKMIKKNKTKENKGKQKIYFNFALRDNKKQH